MLSRYKYKENLINTTILKWNIQIIVHKCLLNPFYHKIHEMKYNYFTQRYVIWKELWAKLNK